MRYIELFGGCGGMSLGLESAGFSRVLANEISPMAAETFAYNLVQGSRTFPPPNPKESGSWAPHFTFLDPPEEQDGLSAERSYRDWRSHVRSGRPISKEVDKVLRGSSQSNLLVGDARRLCKALDTFRIDHPIDFKKRFESVDLMAGGPPCQSFSLAGRRNRNHPRNMLFEAFVGVVELIRPKVVLFENVLGITRPFFDDNGDNWHPWYDVCRAFFNKGYLPIPSLVNAADFGVPQSRPRFIMVAISQEVANQLTKAQLADWPGMENAISNAETLYKGKTNDPSLIFRAEHYPSKGLWPTPLFPIPHTMDDSMKVTVDSAIGDLLSIDSGKPFHPGKYAQELGRVFESPHGGDGRKKPENHGIRNHRKKIEARFRLIRQLANEGLLVKSMVDVKDQREKAIRLLANKELLIPQEDGNFVESKQAKEHEISQLLESLYSAKNVQKCLIPDKPAPAQLSIPDDSIHWGADRVLTIREMARIQSFPDWFEFRSKETTGGSLRSFEVPQYTQVANAVPPLLARAFGKSIRDFLEKLA